jgi:hypothetical protein
MPRYVILRHECPPGYARPSHYDFMLETGDALRTWALAERPRPGVEIAAERLPDHRKAYLDYEGAVSGGRGAVARWDEGTYTLQSEDENQLVATLNGRRLRGVVKLLRRGAASYGWTFFA